MNNIEVNDYKQLRDVLWLDDSSRGLAIRLILLTGTRPNDILRITHKSFNVVESSGAVSIKIVASKGSNDRVIPLPLDQLARIKVLMHQMKERGKPFSALIGIYSENVENAYHLVRRHFIDIQMKLWGEVRYTLKSFRHALATRAIKAGMDIMQVKAILGHKALSSTAAYLEDYKKSISLNEVQNLVMSDL
jgi:integrase